MRINLPVSMILLLSATNLSAQQVVTLPARDRPLNSDSRVVFSVGRLDGNSPDVFGSVAGVAFDRSGNLLVLDALNGRVVLFDTAGRYSRDFGSLGSGPGEFRRANALAITSDGSIVVRDSGARGFHVFNADGSFSNFVRNSGEHPFPVGPLKAHPRGVITAGLQIVFSGTQPQGLDHIPLVLQPLQENGAASMFHRVLTRPMEVAGNPSPTGGGVTIGTPRKLGEVEPSWAVLQSGGIAVAAAPTYEIQVTGAAGRVQQLIRRGVAPRTWTARDRSAVRARERDRLLASGGPRTVSGSNVRETGVAAADIGKRLDQLEYSERIAPIRSIATDHSGRLWIGRAGVPFTEDGPIDIVSADLRYLGTLPPQRLPDAFGPAGRAAYIVRDELGVARVVVRQFSGL
jgi:hypothetical protein